MQVMRVMRGMHAYDEYHMHTMNTVVRATTIRLIPSLMQSISKTR